MRTILSNLRHGLRVLAKSPGYTAVAVIILALGIGASTAIFSILYAAAIRPLPYADSDQLVVLWRTNPLSRMLPPSGPDFLDWVKQSNAFSTLAAAKQYDLTLTDAGENERLHGYRVTPDFFQVLNVHPEKGRLYASGDDQPGRDHVIVLGTGFQARGHDRQPTALGGTVTLDSEEFEVIGSVPASFRFPAMMPWVDTDPDFYVPFPIERLDKDRQDASLWVIGRLKPGVTVPQAQAQMTTIASRLAQQYPESNAGIGIRIVSLRYQVSSSATAIVTPLLFGGGLLVAHRLR